METPLNYPTKSHRRYYKKRAKKLESFLRRFFRQLDKALEERKNG